MHAVIIDPRPEMLEQQRRLGHDQRDEVWHGVRYMAPQPLTRHLIVASDLGDDRSEAV
jgi:hypothetical protein